jgi:branched-chain amino acid aminotransferase
MSMSDRDGTLWLDGRYIPWRTANTHVLTHSLHYGMAVFEGVRAYRTAEGTAVFRLREHTERLLRSAHILQIPVPFTLETLMDAQCQVVAQNHLEEGYIRPLVYLGSEKMGVSPRGAQTHVAIAAWPWGAYLGEEALQQGIRVKVSSYTRHHPNITLCKAKASGNYMNSIEGSGENLFMVKRGVLYTPDLSSALEGITRDSIIQLAQEMGITVLERRISRDELYTADEVFFTGTAAEVTPIREIDRRVIGRGARGPLTEKLQSAYFDCVKGRAPAHRDWLTFLGD